MPGICQLFMQSRKCPGEIYFLGPFLLNINACETNPQQQQQRHEQETLCEGEKKIRETTYGMRGCE